MAPDPSIFAVLTGDFIASSKLAGSALTAAQRIMRDTVDQFEEFTGGCVVGRLEFFRGDAWQLLLDEPRAALRLALLLRAQLRWKAPIDTRIAIGIGAARTINRRKISLSTGEAFEASGHALDAMTGYFTLTAALAAPPSLAVRCLPALLHLCSDLLRGWTTRQAEICAHALLWREATHEEIGAMLERPVKKQTVTSALRSAHFRALMEAMAIFEDTDWMALPGVHGNGNETD